MAETRVRTIQSEDTEYIKEDKGDREEYPRSSEKRLIFGPGMSYPHPYQRYERSTCRISIEAIDTDTYVLITESH